jgi:hypothetical protein
MSKHTPGPWHYQEKSDAYTHIIRGPNNEYVAGFSQHSNGRSEADARLAAAAPELLEAARVALESLRAWNAIDIDSRNLDDDMKAAVIRSYEASPEIQGLLKAIAKAEGRS